MIRKPHLGRNISQIRAFRGMKQATMGSALRISQQAVSQMERQESISTARLEKIARILKVNMDTMNSTDEQEIIRFLMTEGSNKVTNLEYIVQLLKKLTIDERKDLYIDHKEPDDGTDKV